MTDPFTKSIFLKAAAEELAEIRTGHDDTIKHLFGKGDKKTVYADDDGEVELGSIQRTKGRAAWRIVDRTAFVRWVEENAPGAVVHVPTVVDSWEKQVLKDGCVAATGEIPDGMEKVTPAGSWRVDPTDVMRDRVRAVLPRMLELEAGE